MTIWFTGDTHFGHANVIKYAGRPFASAEEMDEGLIERWNAVVRPGDLVYHLGDVALCKPHRAIPLVMRLNGQKHLIFGNHDKALRRDREFIALFQTAKDFAEVKVGEDRQRITLCHYAMRIWNKSHHGAWNLYGHSHGSLPDDPHALQLDVGVDAWGYRPVSFEEVRERMSLKEWKPIDHHGASREDDE